MRISFPERIGRFAITTGFVVVMIIFWAIPVAFVGTISNINYLTNKLHWLRWILDIPPAVLGVITGLLPSILLAVLMALLPIILRCRFPYGSLSDFSDGEMGWSPNFVKGGIVCPEYLFPLPGNLGLFSVLILGHPSIPCHRSGFLCLRRRYSDHQQTRIRNQSARHQSPQIK